MEKSQWDTKTVWLHASLKKQYITCEICYIAIKIVIIITINALL